MYNQNHETKMGKKIKNIESIFSEKVKRHVKMSKLRKKKHKPQAPEESKRAAEADA